MQHITLAQRIALLAVPFLLATAVGCKKEFDTPPVRTLPTGSVITIAQLKAMYDTNTGVPVHFSDSAGAVNSVYAVVTADEQNGNLYKNIYVQDHTGAIAMRLLFSGGLYQGDSIRIYLPGTVLSPYRGLMQLGSVDVDNNVVKQATGVYVAPTPISINDLAQAGPGGALQGKLVTLSNVQFIAADTGQTYADAPNQGTLNRTLENCSGGTAVVRNSGYANFASRRIPSGKGTFTGIASWYDPAPQLWIRDINEVQLNGPRCGMASCDPQSSLNEDFSTVQASTTIDLECWLNVFTEGDGIRRWRGGVSGANRYAEATVSSAESGPVEYWLVTPPMTYSPGMTLSFSSAIGSAWMHDGLSVHISTDINLTDAVSVQNAPWQQITAPLAGSTTPVEEWLPSGSIPLDGFLTPGANFVVGFKYNGTPSTANTPYRIDNVQLQ